MRRPFFSMWHCIGIALALWGMCLYPAQAGAAEAAKRPSGFNHDFWLYYVAVQHSLQGNEGELNTAMMLDRINPKATAFIAKFWWKKVERDCDGDDRPITKTYYYQKDEVDIMQNVEEELKYCAYEVLFNNWAEINTTIRNRLKTEYMDNRNALIASLKAVGLLHRAY